MEYEYGNIKLKTEISTDVHVQRNYLATLTAESCYYYTTYSSILSASQVGSGTSITGDC